MESICTGNECLLLYVLERSAWMEANAFKWWFEDTFLPAMRSRAGSLANCHWENFSCHTDISNTEANVIELSSITAAR